MGSVKVCMIPLIPRAINQITQGDHHCKQIHHLLLQLLDAEKQKGVKPNHQIHINSI